MADLDLNPNSMSRQVSTLKSSTTVNATNYAIFQSIATMKTYLHANGYTAAQTILMTKNDLINAARQKLSLA